MAITGDRGPLVIVFVAVVMHKKLRSPVRLDLLDLLDSGVSDGLRKMIL